MKKEKRVDVYTTKNYAQFKKLLGNREVTPKRIDKIIKSIESVGYVTNPIIVNERMEIIDGQGRYEALKQLGMPIDYIVVKGVGVEACLNMNIYQEKWKIADYIDSYAERGDENYIKLKQLLKEYPLFGLSVIATAINSVSKYNASAIKNGTLIITDEDYIKAIDNLDFIKELVPFAKRCNGKLEPFFQAVLYIEDMAGVDKNRLIQKIKENIGIMNNWSDVGTAIQSIEEVYNKGLSAKNHVFMFTEYRKLVFSHGGVQQKTQREYYIQNKLEGKR